MKRIKLTKEERAIERALLKGEYVSVSKTKYAEITQAVIRARKRQVPQTQRDK